MSQTQAAVRESDREQTWREIMVRWQQTGLSQQAFCEREQLKLTTFGYWRRELKRRDSQAERAVELTEALPTKKAGRPPKREVPLFVPVEIVESPGTSCLEIVLCDGLVIRVPRECDLVHIAQVVKTLEAR